MRLKFTTHPPLPPLKAWTVPPSTSTTVRSLKTHLHTQLLTSLSSTKALEGCSASDMYLELEGEEGFELLDETGLDVLDPKADVLVVRLRSGGHGRPAGKKRKAVDVDAGVAPGVVAAHTKKKRKVLPPPVSSHASSPPMQPSPPMAFAATPASLFHPTTHHQPGPQTPSILESTTTNGRPKTNGKPKVIGRLPYTPIRAASSVAGRVNESKDDGRKGKVSKGKKVKSTAVSSPSSSSEDPDSSGSSSSSSVTSSESDSDLPSAPPTTLSFSPVTNPETRRPNTTTKTNPTSSAPIRLDPTPILNPVPPGKGTSATKGRNKRRRLGRKLAANGGKKVGLGRGQVDAGASEREGTDVDEDEMQGPVGIVLGTDKSLRDRGNAQSKVRDSKAVPTSDAVTPAVTEHAATTTHKNPSGTPAKSALQPHLTSKDPPTAIPSTPTLASNQRNIKKTPSSARTNMDQISTFVPPHSLLPTDALPPNILVTSKYFEPANRKREEKKEKVNGVAADAGSARGARNGQNRKEQRMEKRRQREELEGGVASRVANVTRASGILTTAELNSRAHSHVSPQELTSTKGTADHSGMTNGAGIASSAPAPVSVSLSSIQAGREGSLTLEEWKYLEMEGRFESLPLVDGGTDVAGLRMGTMIAWKAVVLDFTTYTPELKLQIATLAAREQRATVEGTMIFVHLKRPIEPCDEAYEDDEEWGPDEGPMRDEEEEEEEEKQLEDLVLTADEFRGGEYRTVRTRTAAD